MTCDKQCEHCKPVLHVATYKNMTEQEKNNETKKSACRTQKNMGRYWKR